MGRLNGKTKDFWGCKRVAQRHVHFIKGARCSISRTWMVHDPQKDKLLMASAEYDELMRGGVLKVDEDRREQRTFIY